MANAPTGSSRLHPSASLPTFLPTVSSASKVPASSSAPPIRSVPRAMPIPSLPRGVHSGTYCSRSCAGARSTFRARWPSTRVPRASALQQQRRTRVAHARIARGERSVGERFQVAEQRTASAVKLSEALRGVAQRAQVLNRRSVQPAVSVARGDPQAVHAGITCRDLTAQLDDGQRARLHQDVRLRTARAPHAARGPECRLLITGVRRGCLTAGNNARKPPPATVQPSQIPAPAALRCAFILTRDSQ